MEDFPSKRRYSVADDMMVSKLKDIVKVNFSRNVSKYCMYMLPWEYSHHNSTHFFQPEWTYEI